MNCHGCSKTFEKKDMRYDCRCPEPTKVPFGICKNCAEHKNWESHVPEDHDAQKIHTLTSEYQEYCLLLEKHFDAGDFVSTHENITTVAIATGPNGEKGEAFSEYMEKNGFNILNPPPSCPKVTHKIPDRLCTCCPDGQLELGMSKRDRALCEKLGLF